jgi:hypothetical protein
LVYKIIAVGAPAYQDLTTLRHENKRALAIAKMMYNAKAKRRHELLDGLTPILALVDEFAKSSFRYAVHCNTNGKVEHLVFLLIRTQPDSTKLARRFNSITLMDCTYKTNRFGMPLLHIIGRMGLNTFFSIAFIFLEWGGRGFIQMGIAPSMYSV